MALMIPCRTFAAGALAVIAVPEAARAQRAGPKKRIGWLSPGLSSLTQYPQAFKSGLAEFGWVEDRDYEISYRFAESRFDRLPDLAKELVAMNPDLLVAAIAPAQIVLHDLTKTIPIVFALGGDPVLIGLAVSHNRPGGNVTGIMSSFAETFLPKLLQYGHELLPAATRIGLPMNVGNPTYANSLKAAREAATILKVELVPVELRGPGDLDAAFARLKAERVEIVCPIPDNIFFAQSPKVGRLAAELAVPWIGQFREEARDGATISYGVNILANDKRVAYYADRIFKGTPPGEMPIEFPTVFDLVVNLKAARALGLTIPETIMISATEIIE